MADNMSVRISAVALRLIAAHAAAAYPEECCGILLGRENSDGRIVRDAIAVSNERADERTHRYVIEADTIRHAEATAQQQGLDIVGFYHSHPDHPAEPSTFDRDHSWPWYTYIIVPSRRDGAGTARAWRLQDDRAAYDEQQLFIDDTPAIPSEAS